MVSIATWNVNSIKARLPAVLAYLKNAAPDIVLLQELKCVEEAFPTAEIESLGYNLAIQGQKTYNGVAVLSKFPIDETLKTLPGSTEDTHARYIECVISLKDKAIRVASVYVPNGQSVGSDKFAYKLDFFDRLYAHAKRLLSYEEILVIGGDYNVAPDATDVYAPARLDGTVCFHPEERARFRKLLHTGFSDAFRLANPSRQQFSWWDYRMGWEQNRGMRIDHLLLSPEAVDTLESCHIETELRGEEKASDHVPVACKLRLE